jgi:hypothetical protein
MDQATLDQATKEMAETNRRCEEIRHQIGKLRDALKIIDPEAKTWSLEVSLTNLDHHSDPRRSLHIDRPFFNLYDFRHFIYNQGMMYLDGLYECLRLETAQMTHKLLTLLKGEIDDSKGTNEPGGSVDGNRDDLPQRQATPAQEPETT